MVIRGKTEKGKEFLNKYFSERKDEFVKDDDVVCEFAYFRKCWNIRERFEDIFGLDEDQCYNYMNFEDLYQFKEDVLKYFLDENNWEYNDVESQVFTWEETLPSIASSIRDIVGFFDQLGCEEVNGNDLKETDFEIYFYDSY